MADLDLNLLRTFDALMEHHSVTRAASHLGVTQPAVSHALARLRKTLDDPLFIRAQSGLQPTARAQEIAGGVRKGLLQLQNALTPTTFDPATAERHFTIAASSYFCALLIPTLVERTRLEAPGVSLRLVPSGEMLVPLLDQGAIDLAFGASLETPSRIVVEPLYRERLVWIASPDNPIVRERIPPDRIDDATRIMLAPSRPFETAGKNDDGTSASADQIEWAMTAPDRNRITVYDSQTALELVARTDLIARVPEKMAELAVIQRRVVTLDWIREELSYEMSLIWHARQRSDPGLTWLREKARDAVVEKRWPERGGVYRAR